MQKKKCNACSKTEGRTVLHPLYYFHRNASTKDGLAASCRFTACAAQRERYQRFGGVKCIANL